jgi:hypothetical protein
MLVGQIYYMLREASGTLLNADKGRRGRSAADQGSAPLCEKSQVLTGCALVAAAAHFGYACFGGFAEGSMKSAGYGADGLRCVLEFGGNAFGAFFHHPRGPREYGGGDHSDADYAQADSYRYETCAGDGYFVFRFHVRDLLTFIEAR